jgi:formate dehydrogenase
LWGAAHRCAQQHPHSLAAAGFGDADNPFGLGEAVFDAICTSPSGVVFSVDDYDVSWTRVATDDGRVHLAVAELLDELRTLLDDPGPTRSDDYPFVLAAGERRSFTANTILRDPAWRKRDAEGALRIGPVDAAELGVATGDAVRVTTRRGTAVAIAEVDEAMQPGHVSLPNGLGVDFPDGVGDAATGAVTGVAPNELTSSDDRDWLAGTPFHKHVPCRLERVEPAATAAGTASAAVAV